MTEYNPELGLHLSSDERGRVRPGTNIEALERLLGALPPEARGFVKAAFLRGEEAERVIEQTLAPLQEDGVSSSAVRVLFSPLRLSISDLNLQELLDQATAPARLRNQTIIASNQGRPRLSSLHQEPVEVIVLESQPVRISEATIRRRPDREIADTIVLSADRATVPDLDLALTRLFEVRMEHGVRPAYEERIEVRPESVPRLLPLSWANALDALLRAIHESELRYLDADRRGRSVIFTAAG